MELPGYIIDRQIGKGGMARVYLARHIGLDRQVAIKVMNRQLDEDDSGFSERFLHEARIVANLTHQHIVTVYDVGSHDGYNYIAMEYLPGGITLDHRIKQGIKLSDGITTVKQIAAALGFAHKKGIVHRDVKPENIMYREDGSAVLTDFGIARATSRATRMTATGTVIGTPHYMSPEQAQGHEVGPYSDIYSLGIVLYEVLTGQVPYDADSSIAVVFKHISEPLPTLPPAVAAFQPVVERMLAKQAADRYNDCEHIINDLAAIEINNDNTITRRSTAGNTAASAATATLFHPGPASGNISQATQLYQPNTPQPVRQRPKWLVPVAASIFVVLAAGSVLYFLEDQPDDKTTQATTNQLIKQVEQKPENATAQRQQQQLEQERQRQIARQATERKIEQEKIKQQEAERQRRLAEQQRLAEEKKASEAAREAEARRLAEEKKRRAQAAASARKLRQEKITTLLRTAETQLASTRLRKAYGTYRQILKLDRNNKKANKGIQRVANRYLSLALTAARQHDFTKAQRYFASAVEINPNNDRIAETEEKIFEMESEYKLKLAEKQTEQQQATSASENATATSATPAEQNQRKRRAFGGF